MIPLIDTIDNSDDFTFFKTTDGVRGCALSLDMIDVEAEDADLRAQRLSLWFRTLSSSVRVRFHLSIQPSQQISPTFPRASSMRRLGFVNKSLVLVIEENAPKLPFLKFVGKMRKASIDETLLLAVSSLRDLGFSFRPLDEASTRLLFASGVSQWASTIGSVETGSESIGVVRLNKPSATSISVEDFATSIAKLPAPFEVRLSVEKISASQTELMLNRRLKQFNSETGKAGEAKAESAENALVETSISGEALLNYELLIICSRPSKPELRQDLGKVAAALKVLGDVSVETVGLPLH